MDALLSRLDEASEHLHVVLSGDVVLVTEFVHQRRTRLLGQDDVPFSRDGRAIYIGDGCYRRPYLIKDIAFSFSYMEVTVGLEPTMMRVAAARLASWLSNRWRKRRDSNPKRLAARLFSKQVPRPFGSFPLAEVVGLEPTLPLGNHAFQER